MQYNLDLLHHPGKGGLQSPELPRGVLLFDNYYVIVAFLDDSDSLGSRFLTLDLLHLVLLCYSQRHHLGAQWLDSGSDHALRCLRERHLLLRHRKILRSRFWHDAGNYSFYSKGPGGASRCQGCYRQLIHHRRQLFATAKSVNSGNWLPRVLTSTWGLQDGVHRHPLCPGASLRLLISLDGWD